MDERQLWFLASAASNDSCCAIVRRQWGGLWGADYTTIKGMEAQGLLQFKSCHRDPVSGDFIRRSEITDEGLQALRVACGTVA